MLPIRRLRLELDRTLRTRAFFLRALQGRLDRREYLDLLGQLTWLVEGLTFGHGLDLTLLGHADARDVAPSAPLPLPCPAIRLLPSIGGALRVSDELACDACLAVLGTSWTADAADRLGGTFPRATRLLAALSDRSRASVDRLGARLTKPIEDPQPVYALAELARGSLLGLATYLDSAWPTPVAHVHLDLPENDGHARHFARA
jgi:hypothetical protein